MNAEERWPIARDAAISLGMGFLVAAFYLFFAGGFWAAWLACSGAIFFGIMLHHVFSPMGSLGALASVVASGAAGGTIWWLVGDSAVPAWAAAIGGAALVGGALLLETFGEKVMKPFFDSDSQTHPLWKRSLKALTVLVVLAVLILGPAFLTMSNQ